MARAAFVLIDEGTFANAFFPAAPTDRTTPIGAAENAGDIRAKDISSFLFAYLFSGKLCCVLGFQTEALLPWFAGVTPSKAIHGAYSYPALTMANVSQNPGCTPPL